MDLFLGAKESFFGARDCLGTRECVLAAREGFLHGCSVFLLLGIDSWVLVSISCVLGPTCLVLGSVS